MGFMDAIKKAFTQDENKENYLGLDESIITKIAKIKQKIMAMKIYYPEKAQEIEEEISNLEEYIQDCIQIGIEEQNHINEAYLKIMEDFQSFNKVSQEKFLFSEVKRVYQELNNLFFGKEDEEHTITEDEVERLKQTLEFLDKNKKQFTGIKQQQYIKAIIDAKYRLRCCKMLCSPDINTFEDAPKVEKIFYANLFVKDIQDMYDEINKIKGSYQLEELEISLDEQEKELDSLINPISDKYVEEEERLITDIFEDVSTMKRYIQVRAVLRNQITHLHTNIQEQKQQMQESRDEEERRKIESEKYKTLRQKLAEIEKENFDISEIYNKIINYETQIAKEKGLLDKKSNMRTEDIEFLRIDSKDIIDYIVSARKQGIGISIFPDMDEQRQGTIIAKPKGKCLNNQININIDDSIKEKEDKFGIARYNRFFINFMQNESLDKGIRFSKNLYGYYKEKSAIDKIIEAYKLIEERYSNNRLSKQSLKFYIEMPYTRPMVPILERLKEAEIEYYVLPLGPIKKCKPTKKIYLNQEDLEKYKQCIHSKISNGQQGIITMGYHDKSDADLIQGEVYIPLDRQEQEK